MEAPIIRAVDRSARDTLEAPTVRAPARQRSSRSSGGTAGRRKRALAPMYLHTARAAATLLASSFLNEGRHASVTRASHTYAASSSAPNPLLRHWSSAASASRAHHLVWEALTMSPNVDQYERITARILEALERGVPPWRQPWKGSAPYNVRTGRPYRGINTLLLALELKTDPRWGTFRAWKESGSNVRKGEHGTHIVLWKRTTSKTRLDDNGEPAEYAFMRSYVVFNATQVDNAPALELEGEPFEPCAAAESILEGMPNRPELVFGGDSAFYRPSEDLVTLPPRESFEDPAAFYLTAFHELTHSVGHESRLGGLEPSTFGSDPYAKEELVAEIGAAMLGAACELESRLEASAAYIEGWRRKISQDPKLIVRAAAESQRRADYVRGISWEETTTGKEARQHANA